MVLPWLNQGSPMVVHYGAWSYHGRTMVYLPLYHGRFCRGTPILVNVHKSPEVDEWLSKSESRINNHLFKGLTGPIGKESESTLSTQCRFIELAISKVNSYTIF